MEYNSRVELNKAREKSSVGEYEKAVYYYFKSINYFSPIGASQTAASELLDLALFLEERGDKKKAYFAFLRLRGSLSAARSFYTPRNDLIIKANMGIANYLAHEKQKNSPEGFDLARETDYYYSLYASYPPNGQFWYFIAVLGFVIWTISGVKSIFRIFPQKIESPLKERFKSAKVDLGLFVLGYALWLTGMATA
jgi:tetratricopeptide (TPR) repeat protein